MAETAFNPLQNQLPLMPASDVVEGLALHGLPRQLAHLLLDLLLVGRDRVDPLLVPCIDLVSQNIPSPALQVDTREAFEVLDPDQLFHRSPDRLIDLIRARWQKHEEVVPQ